MSFPHPGLFLLHSERVVKLQDSEIIKHKYDTEIFLDREASTYTSLQQTVFIYQHRTYPSNAIVD